MRQKRGKRKTLAALENGYNLTLQRQFWQGGETPFERNTFKEMNKFT